MGTFNQLMSAIEEGKEQFGSYSALSRESGVSESNISRWRKGQQVPRLAEYAPILDAIGAQIVFPGQTVRDFVRVTSFRLENVSAWEMEKRKDPSVPDPLIDYLRTHRNDLPAMLFHPDKLKDLEVDAQHALLFTVCDGDMWPSIKRDDQVLVDLRLTSIENGSLYLVSLAGKYSLRRLTRRLSGLLMSADSAGEETVPPELEPKITILGKVVWLGKAL